MVISVRRGSILVIALAAGSLGVSVPADGQRAVGVLSEPAQIAERSISPYVVRAWTTDDGLPVNSVTAIEQTHEGHLWLGTFGGLVRFDGVAFRTFTSADTPGLGDDRILALHEDAAGTLWIGTQNHGVFRRQGGEFSVPPWAAKLPHPQVWRFHESADGTLWVRTMGGLLQVAADGTATVLRAREDGPKADVLIVRDSADGPVFLGAFAGGVEGATEAGLRSIPLTEEVRTAGTDVTGTLWAGAMQQGLLRLTGDRLERVALADAPEPVFISALLPDTAGGMWVGTEETGFFHLDDGRVLRPVGRRSGLAEVSVRALHRDREGNLWVGTEAAGLYRLTPRSVVTHVPAHGSRLGFVPVVGDGSGGVWAGATCGGLVRFRAGVFERYGEAEGLPAQCVWALHRDADGTLWVGRQRGGLLRLRDRRVTLMSAAEGLDGDQVRAILRDRAGVLWVGTESAINRLDPDGGFTPFRLPVQPAGVTALIERREGGLWVGARAGLFRFVDGAFAHWDKEDGLSRGPVRALLEDRDGTLWVGTYGGGLSRLRDGRITRYTRANGLFDMFLSSILDDGRGRLWMSSNHGIFYVARSDLEAVAAGRATTVTSVWFDRRDGMATSEANGGGQPAGWRATDGRLWFSTVDGLVEIDPTIRRNAHPPPVVIERVVVDRRLREADGRIELPAGTRNLEIHYAGLSYRAPEKVHFLYRLVGYDEEWIDAGTRRVAYYTRLPPGRYRFLVRARNEDGIWSEADAVLAVRQLPFIYQTPWFLALCVGLLVAVAAVGYRLRMRALVRRTAELESAVAARTAEVVKQRDQLAEQHRNVQEAHQRIREAHDDLLAILDQTEVGVCLIDDAGTVEFLNSTAERVLGCANDEAAGQPWHEVLPLSVDDRRRAEALLAESDRRRIRVPLRLDTADEHRYWIELDARDDPRDPERHILYLYDVTELYDLHGLVGGAAPFHGMVGETAAMRMIYRQIRDVASVDSMVIVEGETGTGKELAARAIHDLSARKGGPYVAVNCAGLTESLLSSQLFGHRRGAFTGAVADQVGLFEAASGGTLLLDEIGDIPPSVQASLLRVLEEGEITRVGESRPRKIDVRIIAATHRDLDAEVAAGRFRQDLYFRLRVARIRVPPLRERRDDIPLLIAWFLSQARVSGHAQVHGVSRAAAELLLAYPWPGNVRELRGTIESAALAADGRTIEATDLPAELLAASGDGTPTRPAADLGLDPHQRLHVELALERTHGNRAAAARLLGISRATLYRRLHEFGLDA